jgi:hypothetical protein
MKPSFPHSAVINPFKTQTSFRMRPAEWLLLTLLLFFGQNTLGASPSVSPDKAVYASGESIVVTFSDGPGNAKDWLGLYREGQTPSEDLAELWVFVDGTTDGLVALSSGSATFSGLNPGKWVVYFFENDTYEVLASSAIEVRVAIPDGPESVVTDKLVYEPGETIVVTFTDGPGNRLDWVGIYRSGQVPGQIASTRWLYVDGTTSGETGLSSGSVTFAGGLGEGEWDVYFLANDGYEILAGTSIQVAPTTPGVSTDKSLYAQGEEIVVTFARGPGNPKDWIGIYREGQAPGEVDSTLWLYVDGTTSGTEGLEQGTVTFPSGMAAGGEWVVFFLENDGYEILASRAFTVLAGAGAPFVLANHSNYFPGEDIEVFFRNGPGMPNDWIGIYPGGVTPGAGSTRWFYVNNETTATEGFTTGTILFAGGLQNVGDWAAHLLFDEGYTSLAESPFKVVEAWDPVVRTGQRIYGPNEPITVSFYNGPGAPKDWIGVYPRDREPGPGSTLWVYTDGTTSGTEGVSSGTVELAGGLGVGEWGVYLLANDGYEAIAGETFFVEATAVDAPRLSVSMAGDTVTISWSQGDGFILLTSASLSSPDWQPVEGVSNSSVTLPISGTGAFFQLRKE